MDQRWGWDVTFINVVRCKVININLRPNWNKLICKCLVNWKKYIFSAAAIDRHHPKLPLWFHHINKPTSQSPEPLPPIRQKPHTHSMENRETPSPDIRSPSLGSLSGYHLGLSPPQLSLCQWWRPSTSVEPLDHSETNQETGINKKHFEPSAICCQLGWSRNNYTSHHLWDGHIPQRHLPHPIAVWKTEPNQPYAFKDSRVQKAGKKPMRNATLNLPVMKLSCQKHKKPRSSCFLLMFVSCSLHPPLFLQDALWGHWPCWLCMGWMWSLRATSLFCDWGCDECSWFSPTRNLPHRYISYPCVLVTALPEDSHKILTFTVKYVPEWFPGGGFKKFARLVKDSSNKSINLPLQHIKESFQVRELHFSHECFAERNARQILSPFLRLWWRVLRNCQSLVKTG